MKIPAKLTKHDQIAIVATARKVTLEELQPAISLLKSWGLTPVIGSSIGLQENQFAGNDEERAEDLQQQLDNPNIKAIWCAKGGYGTVRILDTLDFTAFKKNPKWIIGYSDVTALHSQVHKKGVASIHGPIALGIDQKSQEVRNFLKKTLFGEDIAYKMNAHVLNQKGEAEGELVGGNLSVLFSLIGSESDLDLKGKILFLEDLDEYLYHIDRMMQNLKRNGWFDQISGLIIGGLNDMNDNAIPFGKTAKEIIAETAGEYDFPVAFNFPAGHIEDNQALILGRKVRLQVEAKESHVSYF
ncbi:LD-carboxypeptidase [Mesonia ostreae]|uniref:LD-carboxypeptidase n=1 Tax=Mesonia ostreae TaxID=861110 RepID=A0ABU2KKI3_9FLAO|nr:LD-carboxypeptidase [Mesonia ostreae]MDT0295220.1 LD-carboxypeptidase [Mesonia ostreae]